MRKLLIAIVALVATMLAPTPAAADNVWIWGVCTDLDSPYPASSEPYNFDAIFRIHPPYTGYYKLVDTFGRTTMANRLMTGGQPENTGRLPVDYSGSFKYRLYYLYNGAWAYIDQSAPRYVDDGIYCP